MTAKQCAWDECIAPAAFATRTRPAWCDAHITEILRQGGLEPLEPFRHPNLFRLTRCLKCGCVAHYRLEYTLAQNRDGVGTCRACYWAEWVAMAYRVRAEPVGAEIVDDAAARERAATNGYAYLGPAPIAPAYRVQCRYCERISAMRIGDIGFGCSCQSNPRRERQVKPRELPELSQVSDEVKPRLNPELVEQWHPELNAPLRVEEISPISKRMIHWRDPECGHQWVARPVEREKRQRLRCPECRTILDSLAWHFPAVAAEWSDSNPLTAWQVRPSGSLPFVPEWICPDDPSHRWQISTVLRIGGSTCPQCRESGKSMVELRYFEAFRAVFGEAFSGKALRSERFQRRSVWVPDVTVGLRDGRTLLVEYDGSYWHANKVEVDREKSLDLLAAGALVVRVRETPLPSLGITDDNYLEVPVKPGHGAPDVVVETVQDWLRSTA